MFKHAFPAVSRALKLAGEVVSCNGSTWLETKKLRPLGNAPGLAVFHLPLRSRSALLCPLRSQRLISGDRMHGLPGLLSVGGPHRTAEGARAGGQSLIPLRRSMLGCWEFTVFFLQPEPARSRGCCPEYRVFLCGFP